MRRLGGSWNDVRGKGFLVALLLASVSALVAFGFHAELTAKAPGDTHCYGGICHRVHTLDETRVLIGQTADIITTHYDAPGIDKYNVGQYTSSGEEFDADNPARAAAANYPDGTELLVWHPVTKRAAHIRVNDFGPFMGRRTLDVTRRVAEDLGFAKDGVTTLKATVVWVPHADEPRYRKGRVYPPSLGLIGVVEAVQHDALARRLIADAPARHSMKGPWLALEPPVAPTFRAESVVEAAPRARALNVALSDMLAEVPRVVVLAAVPPELEPQRVVVEAPLIASEPAADMTGIARTTETAVATAAPSRPVTQPADAPPAVVQPPPAVAVDATLSTTFAQARAAAVAAAGPTSANRSMTEDVASSADARDARSGGGATGAVATVGSQGQTGHIGAAASAVATVAIARSKPAELFSASPLAWIGVGLMLTSLLGAASFGRGRRARAAAAHAGASSSHGPAHDADQLLIARSAAAQAEMDARRLLGRSASDHSAYNATEIEALEDLARELALRDAEREREAASRARLTAAVEAQAAARQELDALEFARTARKAVAIATPPALRTPSRTLTRADLVVAKAPTAERDRSAREAAAAEASRLEIQARSTRAAEQAQLDAMPSNLARDLAAAVLELPGSETFWGNTIIAQAELNGTVRSGSPLRVDGIVNGSCYAPVILVSHGAVVRGVIAAETIVVLGAVGGIVSGRNVTIAASAQVEGDIYYQTMSIDPQAHCDVRFSRFAPGVDPVALADEAQAARQSKAA